MRGRLSLGAADSVDFGEDCGILLRVVVDYQDEVTLGWAQEAYLHLVQEVGEGAIHCTWWKSDHLAQSRILNEAIDEAARADMILVAVRASDPLHPGMKAWIDSWAAGLADHPRTVVVFVGRFLAEPCCHASVEEYLRRAAIAGGLEYMVHQVHVPSPLFPEPSPTRSSHAWGWPNSPSAEAGSPEVTWGINE